MVKKFKLQTIITALLCSVMLLGCSNLIEDLKYKGEPEVPVSSITLNATATVTVEEGSKITLTATVLPADATDKTVVWTSSDETVATVVNGVITGLKAGTVTITATAGGKSVSCTVTVKEAVNPFLTFRGNGDFKLSVNSKNWNGKLDYSTDKETWTEDWDGITPITAAVSNGSYYIYLRGKGNTSFSTDYSNFTTIGITGASTAVECNGNIMTLLDWEKPDTATMTEACFYRLFKDCKKLTKGPDLPSMNLAEACYMEMFAGCNALVTAPELPATTLTDGCYFCMFSECTSLEASPALPATTVTETCYNLMFNACSSLSSIGKISAKVIDKNGAMNCMFHSCPNIKVVETSNPDEAFLTIESATAPMAVDEMFANTKAGGVTEPVAGKSYKLDTPYLAFKGNGAFSLGCTFDNDLMFKPSWNGNLYYSTDKKTWTEWNGDTAIPAVVSNGSYYIYIKGKNNTSFLDSTEFTITNLTLTGTASSVECNGNIMTLLDWESPNTATMGDYCFMGLFYDCDKLTKAPELPALTVSDYGYQGMFSKCSSLVKAPELPATTLGVNCYELMFNECTSLVTPPALQATNLRGECYRCMFENCTSLTYTPPLPATVLKNTCYEGMFEGCTSLTTIGKISCTDITTDDALNHMFKNCSKLKVVETSNTSEAFLTITSMTDSSAVEDMFENCAADSITDLVAGKSYKVDKPFVASNYLTFEGNNTFTLGINGTAGGSKAWDGKVYYSTDKTTWKEWNKSDDSTIESSAVSGGKAYIYLAGTGNTHFAILDSDSNLKSTIFSLEGAATGVACSGNIMSLLDCENVNTVTMGDLSFACLFNGCTKLTKAPDLPATTLSMICYYEMFKDCTSLETAPVLNAGTLTDSCYTDMFNGCTSLKTAPVLNAMSLGDYCYWGMFSGCTSLTASPALPASVLAEACYREMFRGCTSLTSPGKITATQSDKDFVMYEMFIDCSSLKVVEAESGEESFFTFTDYGGKWTVGSMFEGCATGSVTAPTPGKSYKYVIE